MKKIICIALCLLVMIPPCLAGEITLKAPSAVLMSQDGRVLFEKNAHEKRPVASVTKVMTLLLVCEAMENGDFSLSDTVTASEHACSMGGSQIWLKEGEQFSVEEMIKAVVICSANDCAVALSEFAGGTEENFVAKMNERAKELNMQDTHFVNACGLDAPGHLSSAYDVAIMSNELIKYDVIRKYATVWQDTLRNGEFTLTNTNKLVKSYEGLTGLKTGFTASAGYCLSATAERNGLSLCAVVLGGETSQSRNADIAAMLNYGFSEYMSIKPETDRPLMPVPVVLGDCDCVIPELAKAEPVIVPKGGKITKTVELSKSLSAPIEKGEKIGSMLVFRDGEKIAEIPIVAQNEANRLGVFGILGKMLKISFMR